MHANIQLTTQSPQKASSVMAMLWLPRLPRRVLALKLQAGALDDGRRDAHSSPSGCGDAEASTVVLGHLDEGGLELLRVHTGGGHQLQFTFEVQLSLDELELLRGVGYASCELGRCLCELALHRLADALSPATGLLTLDRLEVGTDNAGLLAPLLECLLVRC